MESTIRKTKLTNEQIIFRFAHNYNIGLIEALGQANSLWRDMKQHDKWEFGFFAASMICFVLYLLVSDYFLALQYASIVMMLVHSVAYWVKYRRLSRYHEKTKIKNEILAEVVRIANSQGTHTAHASD